MKKIENRFLINYILMFVISIIVGIFAFVLLAFANDVLSKTLVKNNYTAKSLMMDDYKSIDTTKVIENGGGVQVINSEYEVTLSSGLNTFSKDKLSTAEFTEFLISSNSSGIPYSYNIEYNTEKQFWLVVTFPTSIRFDFVIVHNKEFASVDINGVIGVIVAVIIFYILLLAIMTVIYSKLTSISVINPLRKLCNSAKSLKEGDYTSRVDLNLRNEFGELEAIFNEMAQQIEKEITLRKKSEDNRKRLVLDVSHDLKNPLANILGYAELCYNKVDMTKEERTKYTKIICENSLRANNLITNLFELSKMESSEYKVQKTSVDICEYVRAAMGNFISDFDKAGFIYEFDIPENEIMVQIDIAQMNRVIQNLVTNTVQYNTKGTKVMLGLVDQVDKISIIFKDNGIGIPNDVAKEIFYPFVRVDGARNSQTGGTGLGLAIVEKIILAHGGSVRLETKDNCGCEFIISIPKI